MSEERKKGATIVMGNIARLNKLQKSHDRLAEEKLMKRPAPKNGRIKPFKNDDEYRAWIKANDPEYLDTFELKECPEGCDDGCYCLECRDHREIMALGGGA